MSKKYKIASLFSGLFYKKYNGNPICFSSMPNGELAEYYQDRPLRAGKNPGKARFNIKEVNKFELLENQPTRIKIIYFDKNMDEAYKKKLKFFENLFE